MGETERLDKLLALHTAMSRREAGIKIRRGLVRVNGSTVKKADCKINLEQDRVLLGDQEIELRKKLYVMMHKPTGILSATRDPETKTVLELLPPQWRRKDIFPAGRLDINTTGLLILTDDGDFAHRMLSPKNHVWKLYEVDLDKPVGDLERKKFQEGVSFGEDSFLPAELYLEKGFPSSHVYVRIREGKFHQVKRMFHAVGREVTALKRLQIGALALDPSLLPGETRLLSQKECDLVFAKAVIYPGPLEGPLSYTGI